MFCHQCGANNRDEASFCKKCGIELAKVSLVPEAATNIFSKKEAEQKLEETTNKTKANFKYFVVFIVVIVASLLGKAYYDHNDGTKLDSNSSSNNDSTTSKSTDYIATTHQSTQSPTSTTANNSVATIKPKQNYSEGWIDLQNGITGWVFDNNQNYQVALTFQSVNNPTYTFIATSNSVKLDVNPQDGSFYWEQRPDAVSALNSKGIKVTNVRGFQFGSSGYANTNPAVPKDDYILIKASYNGKPFKLPPDASTKIQRVCAYGHDNYYECYN